VATVGSLAVVLTASATDFERTMGRAARAVKSTEKEFMKSARQMESIGRSWTMGVTVPIVAGFAAVTKAAIDWEDAFAGVRKTVNATEEQLTALDLSLRKMTETIPTTHRELAGIAETAGQLGIQVENIEDFTRVIAMMGTATRLSNEDAAMGMAQMANIMQTGQKSFDRLGSTIVHLGNNLATTEDRIMEYGLRVAGAGKIAGLTEAQVLGIGGAFASVGVEAEAGGSAVSKVLGSMTEAVATNNKHMKVYAAVAGMSAAEFATAWREDAGLAFTQFVEGLGRSGDQAYVVLRNLGLTDQRLTRGFLSVANAGNLLRRSMDMGTKAWEENIALTKEANERYKTAASRLKMLRNRVYNAAISLGGAFAPLLEMAMDKVQVFVTGLQRLAEGFERLPAPVRMATGELLLLIAAIGPAYLAMSLLHKVIAAGLGLYASAKLFAGNAAFAFTAWRMGAATLGESLKYLVGGPIKLVTLAIAATVVASILLAANWDKLKSFAIAAWNAISAAVMYAASLIVRGIGLIVTAIGFIVPAVRGAGQALIGLADSLKTSAGQALNSAKTAASTVKTVQQAAKTQEDMAKTGQDAANTQDGLKDALEGAGKAARNNLQGFDELNQLQGKMGDTAPSLGDIPSISIPEIPQVGLGGLGNIAGIGDQLSKAVETATSAWDRFKKVIEPIKPLLEGIAGVIMVLLVPAIIKSGIEALIAAAKHVAAWVMSAAAAVANGAKIIVQLLLVIARWAWAGIQAMIHAAKIVLAWALQGLAAVKQGAIMIAQFVLIIARWAWAAAQALIHAARMAAAWVVALGPVAWITAAVIALAILIIANWDKIKEKTIEIWGKVSKWLSDTWEDLKKAVSDKWNAMIASITGAWDNIKNVTTTAWNTIKSFLESIWNGLKNTISNVFNTIRTTVINIWSSIHTSLSSVWNNIRSTASSTFYSVQTTILNAFEGVRSRMSSIWSGIWSTIKSYINNIISGVNSMIRGLNNIKFSAPSWVPLIGGKSFSINISTIPMLATGTNYVPQDMLAYLHRGEAVVPREYNPAAVSGASGVDLDALADKIVSALRQAQPAGAGGDIYVYIGNEQVESLVYRSQDKRNIKGNGR
jgi:TP901 family phage tail tape measure protein